MREEKKGALSAFQAGGPAGAKALRHKHPVALEERQEGPSGRGSQGEWGERTQDGWLRGQIVPWLAKRTGLNSIFPNSCPPGTSGCDLIWRWSLC